MQASIATMMDLDMGKGYGGVSFMPGVEEAELLRRAWSGDVEARLELVKEHLDLVVEFAAGYASETGKPFSQMVKVGALAIIRAADDFHESQQMDFGDYVRSHITRAMEEFGQL